MGQSAQIDLFDLLAAKPLEPAKAPAPAETVHWLVVTTKRARTGCGMLTYGIGPGTAVDHETGELFRYTFDYYSGKVTCQACREAL